MGAKPEPFRTLSGEIGKDRTTARAGRNASPFFGTGIHPTGDGGMESDSFDGDLATDDAGTTGWAFNDAKVALGEVILRPGSVGNDALTNPVLVQGDFSGTSGFALSVAGAYVITINRATPAGFTKVVVTAFGRIVGQNSTAADDALYSTLDINGAGGNQFPTTVLAGQGNTSSVGLTTTLDGLTTGANVATALFASTGFANWSSSAANAADLSVTYSWSR